MKLLEAYPEQFDKQSAMFFPHPMLRHWRSGHPELQQGLVDKFAHGAPTPHLWWGEEERSKLENV